MPLSPWYSTRGLGSEVPLKYPVFYQYIVHLGNPTHFPVPSAESSHAARDSRQGVQQIAFPVRNACVCSSIALNSLCCRTSAQSLIRINNEYNAQKHSSKKLLHVHKQTNTCMYTSMFCSIHACVLFAPGWLVARESLARPSSDEETTATSSPRDSRSSPQGHERLGFPSDAQTCRLLLVIFHILLEGFRAFK